MQRGFSLIIIPIMIVLIGALGYSYYISSQSKSLNNQVYSAVTPIPTIAVSPSPSPTTNPSPISTPTLTPSVVATVKPTPKVLVGAPSSGYQTVTVKTEKGDFVASILSIDLNSSRVITDTGNDNDCADSCVTTSLQDFVNKNGGYAGVNGTYFCPASYPDCASKKDSFDFPVYNTRLNRWVNGGNLGWNGRSIVYFDGSGAHYMQNSNGFGGGLSAGVINFPGLVNNGQVQIDDNQSGLSDKQKAIGTKVGIGTRDTKNVMIVIGKNVNMQQFAYLFKSLGATGALNLDTGGSTALYLNGKYIYGPGRNIPNAIIFAH